MTALMAWPNFHREMEERSTIRWQHRLKREHPTCTERISRSLRVRMEGWRQRGAQSGLAGSMGATVGASVTHLPS